MSELINFCNIILTSSKFINQTAKKGQINFNVNDAHIAAIGVKINVCHPLYKMLTSKIKINMNKKLVFVDTTLQCNKPSLSFQSLLFALFIVKKHETKKAFIKGPPYSIVVDEWRGWKIFMNNTENLKHFACVYL